MITTILISSLGLNLIGGIVLYSLSKEKPSKNTKVIYKEKIVYRDKPVEKIVYKDKIIEKIIYKDKPVHEFIKKEPKVSKEKQELLDALAEIKSKKKKSKKDLENIYTIEKVLPNIK